MSFSQELENHPDPGDRRMMRSFYVDRLQQQWRFT